MRYNSRQSIFGHRSQHEDIRLTGGRDSPSLHGCLLQIYRVLLQLFWNLRKRRELLARIPSAGAHTPPTAGFHRAPQFCEGLPLRVPSHSETPAYAPVFPQNVVGHIQKTQPAHVSVVIAHDALERVHARILRRHTVPHVLDDGVRARRLDVLFSRCRSRPPSPRPDPCNSQRQSPENRRSVPVTRRQRPLVVVMPDISPFVESRITNRPSGRNRARCAATSETRARSPSPRPARPICST